MGNGVCQRGEDLYAGEHGGGERREDGRRGGMGAWRDGRRGGMAGRGHADGGAAGWLRGAARERAASLSVRIGRIGRVSVRIGMVGC